MTMKDGICYVVRRSGHKMAVPASLREKLIWYYHDYTVHGGCTAMIEAACKLYVFPGIHRKIRRYVNSCEECAKSKNLPLLKSKRQHTSTPSMPGENVMIDLVGPISQKPTERNNKYILSYIDLFTGWLCLRAIPSKHSSSVLEALSDIFCEVGVPMNIQSDCGREFISALFRNCTKRLGIRLSFSSPYHPQSQGRLERKHKDIAAMLRLLKEEGRSWDLNLPYIAHKLNTKVDPVTRITPWKLFHGYDIREPEFIETSLTENKSSAFSLDDKSLQEWEEKLAELQEKTFKKVYEQKLLQKENWSLGNGNKTNDEINLKFGDRVYAKLPIVGGKLGDRMRGPYKVIKLSKSGTVVLRKDSEEHGKTILLHQRNLKKIEQENSDSEGERSVEYENIHTNSEIEDNFPEKIETKANEQVTGFEEKQLPKTVNKEKLVERRSERLKDRKSYKEFF